MNKNVLFVCIGNTCRSQIAEYIYKNLIDENVSSCGINAKGTARLEGKTIQIIKNRFNIDLKEKFAVNIKELDLDKFDIIYSLDKQVSDYLMSFTSKRDNVVEMFIDDPYGKEIECYNKAFDEIYKQLIKIRNH